MATLFHTSHENSLNNLEYKRQDCGFNSSQMASDKARKKKLSYKIEDGETENKSESDNSEENNFPPKRIKICKNNDQINELEEGEIQSSSENELVKVQCTYSKKDKTKEQLFVSASQQKPVLSAEEYANLKMKLKAKKLRLKSIPRITLKEAGTNASLCILPEKRIPLFITDIQHLLLYSVLGHHSPYMPSRWCQLEKYNHLSQVVVLIAEGISLKHYSDHKSLFQNLTSIFNASVEIVTPAVSNSSIVQDLAAVPLTGTQKEKLIREFGTLETAMKNSKDLMVMMRAVFPIQKDSNVTSQDEKLPNGDLFSRTKLLLSAWQMVEQSYPVPLKGELGSKYADFVLTKDSYAEVHANSPMFGLDCEMCVTNIRQSELTRISVVNEKFEVVYERLVKPYNPIINYVTKFSGITKSMLKDVTTRIEDVQRDLRELLPADAILVGQSLNSDLLALKMMHPYCIDTSVIFNITGRRNCKTKLKTLAKEFLGESIQESQGGHDSVEDSLASLKLTQLKLSKGINFGDAALGGTKKQKPHEQVEPSTEVDYTTSLFNQMTRNNKCNLLQSAQILGGEDIITQYDSFILGQNKQNIKCIMKKSNKNIIRHTCNKNMEHKLTMAHISLPVSKMQPNKIEKTIKKLDQWIEEVWNHITYNSLYIVIFGGEVESNGVCFLGIKKPPS